MCTAALKQKSVWFQLCVYTAALKQKSNCLLSGMCAVYTAALRQKYDWFQEWQEMGVKSVCSVYCSIETEV